MTRIILITAVFCLLESTSFAQGCSDAGVCTIHSIRNNTSDNTNTMAKKNELAIGFSFGKGERNTSVYTPYLEYNRSISQSNSISAKINFSSIKGELGSSTGAGDIIFSLNHSFEKINNWAPSFLAGIKLPLNNSNLTSNQIQLPMPYQTSLGTTDLLFGFNFSRNFLGLTLAFQQPIKAVNSNGFLPENYPDQPLTLRYLPTYRFRRKGDALARVSYQFERGKRFIIRPSLLGIYHLANDSYVDASKIRREINLSSGLTLNGNLFLGYKLTDSNLIELAVGTPFLIRTNRPDGLTRSLVIAIEYKINF